MKMPAQILFAACCLISSCTPAPEYTETPPIKINPSASLTAINPSEKIIPILPVNSSWQIQYSGEIEPILDVDIYNLDLFDTDSSIIAQLHERGIFVMCYFSGGSFEDWRRDASQFPQAILGKDLKGWPGEKWLDIRQIEILKPIMTARLKIALQKNCDGVDPDNVNGYENDTGFPLTYEDQLSFNIFLANAAHERGLAIGLKNDLAQIPDLLRYFDWALNEECFSFNECQMLLPFIQAGKPVFVIEYETKAEDFCPQANKLNFNALQKHWELDAFRIPCN
jgi:hypothetical protein